MRLFSARLGSCTLRPVAAKQKIYEFRVSLNGTDPLVWRTFGVPADYTTHDLHEILQIVMGWHNSHCHIFRIGGKEYSSDLGLEGVSSQSIRLATAIKKSPSGFEYLYDMGDSWSHRVEFVSSTTRRQESPPMCWAGEMACPPEDVGGIGGFEEFKRALADPTHEEHEQWREWAGDDYDPSVFSVRQATAGLIAWWRMKSQVDEMIHGLAERMIEEFRPH